MFASTSSNWRSLFKAHLASARVSVLHQLLLGETSFNIGSNSRILMSNVDAAAELVRWCSSFSKHGSASPRIVIAKELTETTSFETFDGRLQSAAQIKPLDQLGEHDFTHAILHIHTDKSESDLSSLLQQVHGLLIPDGKLILSRRKRDGLAEVLHAAGVPVPGAGSNTATAHVEDDGLAGLVAHAGFAPNGIQRMERSYLGQQDRLQDLMGDMKSALASTLGACEEDAGWKAQFDRAAGMEVEKHSGILLIADVIVATK